MVIAAAAVVVVVVEEWALDLEDCNEALQARRVWMRCEVLLRTLLSRIERCLTREVERVCEWAKVMARISYARHRASHGGPCTDT